MTIVNIPSSNRVVDVCIIDTSFRIANCPLSLFATPEIKGLSGLNTGTFAFLITHTDPQTGSERKLVFDLGPPKNWKVDMPDTLVNNITQLAANGVDVTIDKYVSEILEENGVALKDIEALIWSHTHWDHMGRPSLFPSNVDLIVGPGVKKQYAPGFPENPDSPFKSEEFADRDVVEIFFESSTLDIGGMRAIDYFGDGSFYLLDAPGHCVGHMNALARTTTNPDSFMFLGADSFHHCSQLRPSKHLPLPESISLTNFTPNPCPGELFHSIHPRPAGSNANDSPFLVVSQTSVAIDPQQAQEVVHKVQNFDADENIFIVGAHDWSLFDVIELFPRSANAWKEKGWKENGRWTFLADFQEALNLASAHED